MTHKDQTELRQEQINSLKWAIDELEKEKQAVLEQLEQTHQSIGLKESLDDAVSEQQTLNDRIQVLRDNLGEIPNHSEEPEIKSDLDSHKSSLEDRIIIASERLSALEQERDLEHIALQFKGKAPARELETSQNSSPRISKDLETTEKSMEEATEENRLTNIETIEGAQIETQSRVHEKNPSDESTDSLTCSKTASKAVREAAAVLDLDPEYLLDKSVQAVLRMIERNKNRVTFPLEVKQVDSID